MPRIRRIIAQPSPVGRRATAIDFGGGGAERALADVAGVIGQEAERLFQADQGAKVSAGVQGAATEIDTLRLEVEANPDIDAREQLYRKGREDILQRHRGTILSEQFKNQFDDRIFGISRRSLLQVREGVRASKLDRIRASTITTVDRLSRLAGQAESEAIQDEYLLEIDQTLTNSIDSGAMSAERVANIRIQSQAAIRDEELKIETQSIADELEAKFPNLSQQIKAARERFSGEKEDLVVARLKDRNNVNKAAKEQQEKALLENQVQLAQAGKLTHAEALGAGLTAKGLAAVNRVIDQAAAIRVPAGSDRYWELRRMHELSSPEFRDLEINDDAGNITPDEIADLKNRQLQADTDALESYVQKVDRALGAMGLPTTPEGMAQAKEVDVRGARLFRQRIEAAKKAKAKKEDRRLTGVEIDDIIKFGMTEVIRDDEIFFDEKAPRFTLGIDDIGDVPNEVSQKIQADFAEKGIFNVDKDRIRRVYLDLLLRGATE